MRTSWTSIVAGRFGSESWADLFCYDAATGLGEFQVTDGTRISPELTWDAPDRTTFDQGASVRFAGTLANLLMGRKGSHADWARLDHHNLLDRAALLQLVADVTPKSPAGAFALAAAEVLGMPLAKPRLSASRIAAVSRVWANNGAGVRGDLKAVISAILLHPEARTASATGGKLREPVLKLAAYLRAFPHTSDTGSWKVGNTDSANSSLGQTPLRAPSVFNFYRPGYVAPGTRAATAGLVAPEMQLVHETTAAGWVNYMRDNIAQGVGQWNSATSRRDLQADYSAELALAEQPAALVERVNAKLLLGAMPAELKAEIQGAIEKMAIPALRSDASNQRQVNDAKRARVNAAILLAVVSPEFQVQK